MKWSGIVIPMRAFTTAACLLFSVAVGCGSSLPSGAGGIGGMATGGSFGTGGASGGTGGADAGALAAVCRSFAQAYAAALPAAERCSVGASDPCATLVPQAVSGDVCVTGCQVYVSDATALNAIMQGMEQAGCSTLTACFLAIACATPAAGFCMPGDGGDGRCQNLYNVAR
ncbi:MAG: hypothetical protein ACJ8F1_00780 [Polyangia bacterium]|jgi:hypothetical protein